MKRTQQLHRFCHILAKRCRTRNDLEGKEEDPTTSQCPCRAGDGVCSTVIKILSRILRHFVSKESFGLR
ncbi:hypothetical protein TWF106_004002 [Orbilia oligospora]|uniref:Uncharacterized protein n=1 Tax=Orbilia oligospora TaxID=2813651 RepID=A0A7C8KIY9_ORBOL|nr:hypothetical protein TWF788_008092 [Orbilia oligospora]KAF3199127.1 hypothetical protein TWF106_004002 [Orbilia oligospora]